MLTFKNRSLAGSAALVATLITIAAATPVRAETVSVPVAYGDLDLSTPAGVATLDRRVRRAADRICGIADIATRVQVAQCRHEVLASAHADVRTAQARQAAIVLAAR